MTIGTGAGEPVPGGSRPRGARPARPPALEAFVEPDVLLLAESLSLAATIERELVRSLRLALHPDLPANIEARLWFSVLVARRGADGFTLDTGFLPRLRRRLLARSPVRTPAATPMGTDQEPARWVTGAPASAADVRAFLVAYRARRPTTPYLHLEEDLVWYGLRPDGRPEVDRRFGAVVQHMNAEPGIARQIALWAARVLPRLPREALRGSAAAALLAHCASIHLDGRHVLVVEPPAEDFGRWLPVVLPDGLPTRTIGARVAAGQLELSEPAATGSVGFVAPATDPMVVRLLRPGPVAGRPRLLLAHSQGHLDLAIQIATFVSACGFAATTRLVIRRAVDGVLGPDLPLPRLGGSDAIVVVGSRTTGLEKLVMEVDCDAVVATDTRQADGWLRSGFPLPPQTPLIDWSHDSHNSHGHLRAALLRALTPRMERAAVQETVSLRTGATIATTVNPPVWLRGTGQSWLILQDTLPAGVEPLEDGEPRTFAGYRLRGYLYRDTRLRGRRTYLARAESGELVVVKVFERTLEQPRRRDFEHVLTVWRALSRQPDLPLVRMIDAAPDERPPYVVTNYETGPTLAERLDGGPLDPDEIYTFALSVARALAALHENRIVHGSVFPDHVIFSARGPLLRGIEKAAPRREPFVPGNRAYGSDVEDWALLVLRAASGRQPTMRIREDLVGQDQSAEAESMARLPARLSSIVGQTLVDGPQHPVSAAEIVDRLLTGPSDSGLSPGVDDTAEPTIRPVTLMGIALAGFSSYDEPGRREARQRLRDLVQSTYREVSVAGDLLELQDRGDGIVACIDAPVSEAVIVADLVRELRIGLAELNDSLSDGPRMRLRVALYQGETVRVAGGWVNQSVVAMARYLDSVPALAALDNLPGADLAVILAEQLYQNAVREPHRGLDPATFVQVVIAVKNFTAKGRVHVPGVAVKDVRTALVRHIPLYSAEEAEHAANVIAHLYHDSEEIRRFLISVGLSRGRLPSPSSISALDYWRKVLSDAVTGIIDIHDVYAAAARSYPANPGLRDLLARYPSSDPATRRPADPARARIVDIVLDNEEREALLDELMILYGGEYDARLLLSRISYPPAMIPAWRNPRSFWHEVFHRIDGGVMYAPYRTLLLATLGDFPANGIVGPIAERHLSGSAIDQARRTAVRLSNLSLDASGASEIDGQKWTLSSPEVFVLIQKVADLVPHEQECHAILNAIDLPPDMLPRQTSNSLTLWYQALEKIIQGAIQDGLSRLLDLLVERFPANRDLRVLRDRHLADQPDPDQSGASSVGTTDAPDASEFTELSGLADVLSDLFRSRPDAMAILREIDFPRPITPGWETPQDFWWAVTGDISAGILNDGPRKLITAARQRYPGNQALTRLARTYLLDTEGKDGDH